VTLIGAVAFSTTKEPLRDRSVSALPLTTPTPPDAMEGQQPLVVVTGLVTPAIRLGPQTWPRPPASQGHLERLLPQGGGDVAPHRPPDHVPGLYIQQDRPI
jgi:hypothetical protein